MASDEQRVAVAWEMCRATNQGSLCDSGTLCCMCIRLAETAISLGATAPDPVEEKLCADILPILDDWEGSEPTLEMARQIVRHVLANAPGKETPAAKGDD